MIESGSKARIVANRADFERWSLNSTFQLGQDVYVCNTKGRWALVQSKPTDQYDYNRRTVPLNFLEVAQ